MHKILGKILCIFSSTFDLTKMLSHGIIENSALDSRLRAENKCVAIKQSYYFFCISKKNNKTNICLIIFYYFYFLFFIYFNGSLNEVNLFIKGDQGMSLFDARYFSSR